ncbi:hypothetical protein [Streptomyces sp. NBC_01212]|uniref:hypothetical protein n=1 Tax=Streptomyces sp. NBC_01212 TaxID=2903775 RepID=UPI002E15A68A|nr:hypothetical protein OG722_04865 [Streptomyces sp. NBC_01212]
MSDATATIIAQLVDTLRAELTETIRKEIARELLEADEVAVRSLGPGFMAAAYKLDPSLCG